MLAATLIGIGSFRLATGEGSMGWTAAILAISAVPTVTAATGYCPLYHALGVDWTFCEVTRGDFVGGSARAAQPREPGSS